MYFYYIPKQYIDVDDEKRTANVMDVYIITGLLGLRRTSAAVPAN